MIEHHLESQGKAAGLESSNSLDKASTVASDKLPSSSNRKLKLANPDPVGHSATLVDQVPEADVSRENELERSTSSSVHALNIGYGDCPQSETGDEVEKAASEITELSVKQTSESIGNSIKAPHGWSNWNPLEKDLYLKGLEIFGRNRYVKLYFLFHGQEYHLGCIWY